MPGGSERGAGSEPAGEAGEGGVITGTTDLERGKPVVVLAQWTGKGPRNVLIKRADGSRVVRPFRGLRRP